MFSLSPLSPSPHLHAYFISLLLFLSVCSNLIQWLPRLLHAVLWDIPPSNKPMCNTWHHKSNQYTMNFKAITATPHKHVPPTQPQWCHNHLMSIPSNPVVILCTCRLLKLANEIQLIRIFFFNSLSPIHIYSDISRIHPIYFGWKTDQIVYNRFVLTLWPQMQSMTDFYKRNHFLEIRSGVFFWRKYTRQEYMVR